MKKLFLLFILLLAIIKIQAQNDCASALAIDAGLYPISAINGSEPPPAFCISDYGLSNHYEWYVYTPVNTGSLTVTTDFLANFGVDTKFNVFKGICGNLECVTGADNEGDNAFYLSKKSFNVVAGESYYIVFEDTWSSGGFTFELIEGETINYPLIFESLSMSTSNYTLAVVDMNGDFLDDLVSVDGYEGIVNINYQQEDGTFENVIIDAGTITYDPNWSMAAGDFDNNGFTDLLLAGGGATFLMANEDGTGYFEAQASDYIFCQRSNCVDIDMDGKLDAFVCHDVEPNVYFINDGDGSFTYHQGGLSDVPDGGNYGSVWIDYDNDCDMDLFIAKCRGGVTAANINQLFRNDGEGIYTEVSEESGLADDIQTWSSAWADFDNDGDMDVAVGASSFFNGGHKLMVNNGDGTFNDITANSGWDIYEDQGIEYAPGDFDNDGYVDVFGGNGSFMMNNGDMTFTKFQVDFYPGAIGDLNNDGFLDIVSPGFDDLAGKINQGNSNNHITINTVGTVSNRSAIGARITVYSPSFTQIRDVRSGEGFRYMSSLNAHFGLGTDTTIEKITICWPSGLVEELLNPPINGNILLVEGSVTSLTDNKIDNVKVYPVPTNDLLYIELPKNKSNTMAIIYDLSGKLIMKSTIVNNRIDVSKIVSGFYNIVVNINEKMFQSKFVKL